MLSIGQLLTQKSKLNFLRSRDEIGINPREEWLKSHPKENALLAVWGKAKLFSSEAYDEYKSLLKELDIPLTAQPKSTLPVKPEVLDDYFKYMKEGNDRGVEALRDEASAEIAKLFIKYGDIIDEFSGNSAEARLFRLENLELNAWGVKQGRWKDDLSGENITLLRLRVKYRPNQKEYEALKTTTERDKYLKEHPEYQEGRWMMYALDEDLPDRWLDEYVRYRRVDPRGNRRIAYLATHKGFYEACLECGLMSPIDFGRYGIIYRGKVYE